MHTILEEQRGGQVRPNFTWWSDSKSDQPLVAMFTYLFNLVWQATCIRACMTGHILCHRGVAYCRRRDIWCFLTTGEVSRYSPSRERCSARVLLNWPRENIDIMLREELAQCSLENVEFNTSSTRVIGWLAASCFEDITVWVIVQCFYRFNKVGVTVAVPLYFSHPTIVPDTVECFTEVN